MCYIFNCFGWALDFVQRAITFVLACVLCAVIVTGLLVAIAAGVAYGYNYSMAEFLTFTRQDVTVYMRRGQFYDKPEMDIDREFRRSGEQEDLFGMNKSTDYEDTNSRTEAKSLLNSWGQMKDTRKYAEVLTKYSSKTDDMDEELQIPQPKQKHTAPPPFPGVGPVEVSPNPALIPTTILKSGTSQIVMRKFQTLNVISYLDTTTKYRDDNYFYKDPEIMVEKSSEEVPVLTRSPGPDNKGPEDHDRATQYIPMRHWDTTRKREVQDDMYADDVDEDNLVYKMKSV